MNLLCLISSLQAGGAERVMTWLSEGLAKRGHRVTLVCLEDGLRPPAYGPPAGVNLRYLDLLRPSSSSWQSLTANFHRICTLRRLYQDLQPDIVISFMDRTNILALAAGVRLGLPIVVSEHTDPGRSEIGRTWSLARPVMYPLCRRLVLLSEGLREYFSLRLQARVRIIPNPVTSFQGITKDAPLVGRKRLLAMGRLDYAKGFDLLLDAFVTLVSDFPQWDLRIQGEGPERANLEAKIAQLGLEGRVELPGYTPDPGSVFRGANLLVVSSRVEGFPNVLVEGMSCGLPVLATTCTSAIQEILEGGASGVLVEPDSAVALAEGLRAVMGDENRLMSLGLAARQVTARYAPERVLDMWENLLQKALE